MSSIRPLITLTVIVVVGVILFRKINEGPASVPQGGTETVQSATVDDAPPLASTTPDSTTSATSAPAWNGGTTAAEPATPRWADPVTDDTAGNIPPIPELPPLVETPPTADATSPVAAIPAITPPTSLDPPASIPVAQYSADAPTADEPTPPPSATPFNVTAQAAPTNPVAEAAPADDRYGSMAATQAPSTELTPPVSPFEASWPEIQAALDRQELAQAHKMLTEFYGNPALSATEAQQVDALLSQLAGTVVYSTEHRLEPPYVVHSGDTLESIAQKYEVPWQLLAKINGIPAADLVQPGQELKVIHGPFSAVVELGKGQLTLMLGDRYAGRFPILSEPASATSEGEWTLEQKLVNPPLAAEGVVSASYDAATPTVDRMLVLRKETPQTAGETISIASGASSPTGPAAVAPPAFRISPQDAEELADILSVGSRVTIRK